MTVVISCVVVVIVSLHLLLYTVTRHSSQVRTLYLSVHSSSASDVSHCVLIQGKIVCIVRSSRAGEFALHAIHKIALYANHV